jgi:NADP-dependent 3-hydroxy acid dehydrogenase YdfG
VTGRAEPGRRVAFVTGASSGFGRAIAAAFGNLGWAVGIGARRRQELDITAQEVRAGGGTVFAHVLDVAAADSITAFFAAAEGALGPVDVLVNNAGAAAPGRLWELDPSQIRQMIDVNLSGAISATCLAVRSMLRRRACGDVVFISSECVNRPYPHVLPYGAAKTAVEYVADGLRVELDGSGIRIVTLRVGPSRTDFGAGFAPEPAAALFKAWKQHGIAIDEHMLEPGDVAAATVAAVTADPRVETKLLHIAPRKPHDTAAERTSDHEQGS